MLLLVPIFNGTFDAPEDREFVLEDPTQTYDVGFLSNRILAAAWQSWARADAATGVSEI